MVRKVLTSIVAVAVACAVMVLPAVPASADTIEVTNDDDAGPGSFRQAVDDAAPGDTITFAATVELIELDTPVTIDKSLTITGNGQGATVLSGSDSDVLIVTDDDDPVSVTITDLTIDDAGADGINIGNLGGNPVSLVVERVTITGSFDDAIDIDNDDTEVTLVVRDSTLVDNDDDGIDVSEDGGLAVSDVLVERTTISGNDDGIVAEGEGATVEVLTSTVSGNLDDGIDVDDAASATIVNSTISGNGESGVDASSGGIATVLNSTIVDNTEQGLRAEDGAVTTTNSIVHGNTPDCSEGVTSGGGNIDGDGSCGLTAEGDQPETDPLLGALAANGGPTDTHLPLEGSPAIDAALAEPCPAADQRGESRPQDGNEDGTAVCDVGAVEVAAAQPEPGPTTTTTAPPEIPVAPTPAGPTPVATPAAAQPTFTG